MKKRLHDKKAGIAVLAALIIISLVEIIFRAVVIGEAVFTTPDFAKPLAVIALGTGFVKDGLLIQNQPPACNYGWLILNPL